jgi:hypothetical protein
MALRALLLPSLVAAAALLATLPRLAASRDRLDAGEVTQAGRSLDRALDQVLAAPAGAAGPRCLLFLVDATRALREAGFRERLGQAFHRRVKDLYGVEVGLALVGAKGAEVVPLGGDRLRVLTELETALAAAPANPVRNLYADVRVAADLLAGREGARELVLVSLDNGDVEDDLEATVRALERAKVRVSVIAREAWLADSYAWSHPTTVSAPKGSTLQGGDGAWPQLPFGWLLQQQDGHEVAPGGLALFGLSRLAAASLGRVFLVAGSGGAHACAALGVCSWCNGDHLPPGEVYLPHRVKALAPSVESRDDVLAADARDPWVRRALELWTACAKEGLVRARPPVGVSGATLKLEAPRTGGWTTPLPQNGLGFSRHAKEAAHLRGVAERLLALYDADLARLGPDVGHPRHRAAAETAGVMLHLTVVNLELFEAFCREIAPALTARESAAPQPPEIARLGEDQRYVGWTTTTHCLCHGLLPFRSMRLGWTAEVRDARLAALETRLQAFFGRYDHTPFGIAVRRAGLSMFQLTVQGKVVGPPPRRGGSNESGGESTTTQRPGRSGGGSGDGGPATTGK